MAAKQKRDDEQFVVNVHKYLNVLLKKTGKMDTVALVIDNKKLASTTYGYSATILDIIDEGKGESVKNDELIDHFDDHHTIYDQIYISEGVANQIDRSKAHSVLFIGTDLQTYRKGKDVFQSHPIKVINVE